MDTRLLDRLSAARDVLGGVDGNGRRVHTGMSDAGVISMAHGNGTRRPHATVVAAGITALLETERGSLDDYLFHQPHEEFAAAVTADFRGQGVPAEIAGNICVDSGTTRLYAAFLHACSEPGDVFLVPRSYYHQLPSWCDLFGVQLSLVPTSLGHSYKLTPEDLDEWIRRNPRRRTRGLFLFNPTQTGALYTAEELQAIALAVADHDLVVLEDSVFAGTEFPGELPVHHLIAAAPGLADRVVTVKGASKAFNLANARIGWACGPADLIRRMDHYTTTTLATIPYTAKAMALAALRAPRSYLLANSRESAARTTLITELVLECNAALAAHADEPVLHIPHQPQAGHALLVSTPGLVGRSLPGGGVIRDSIDVTRLLLSTARVAVSPGYSLGFDGTELRLGFGSVGLKRTYPALARAELVAALECLETRCGVIDSAAGAALVQVTERLRTTPAEVGPEIFRPGRDLITEAFRERILPALTALLARPVRGRARERQLAAA